MKKSKKIFVLAIFIICNLFSSVYGTSLEENTATLDSSITSEAVLVMEASTGKILYEKNAYERRFPASTTKIMTAILTLENCKLDDTATASEYAVMSIPSGYTNANIQVGETLTIKDLLYALMIPSANDSAIVLGEHISGSEEAFCMLMNEKAKELGCKDTHFVNPSGIHNKEHYTTAYDLSLIAKYCMKNSIFRNIVSLKSCTINSTNKFGVRKYANTNDLLSPSSKYYLEDCIGIKTGYTAQAKNCLISACNKDNLELISVILGANQTEKGESSRYIDTINLFNYGYSNFSIKTFAEKDDVIETIEVKNGSKDTKNLDLILEDSISGLIGNNDEVLNPNILLKENISAPIAKNSVIGTVTYSVGDISYTKNLIASHDVEKNNTLVVILVIILSVIIFLILMRFLSLKSKKKRKRKIKYKYL